MTRQSRSLSVRPDAYQRFVAAAAARGITVAYAEIHEMIGDHVVRHGGEACQVFEAAVVRAIEASEKGWRFEV